MYLETERLFIRELEESDIPSLLKIKYDGRVLKYDPEFIKRDAVEPDALETIRCCIEKRDTGEFSKEILYAAVRKETGEMAGVITVSELGFLREIQMGWMFLSEVAGHGYAAEAARAVSDALLDKFDWSYIAVVMDEDNPASFRTAQNSGFRLFEKRVPYDYHYSRVNAEDHGAVGQYFAEKQVQLGSAYYYFRKYSPRDSKPDRFYGDIPYTGRFA